MANFGNKNNRMTIYDLMEAKGHFAANPANAGAMAEDGRNLYEGPREYPKMMYHPKGEQQILVPERVEPTPTGPVRVPAQYTMVTKTVKNEEEESEARLDGWHDHPADALAAAGKAAPPKSSDQRIQQLEAEIQRLKKVQSPTAPKVADSRPSL